MWTIIFHECWCSTTLCYVNPNTWLKAFWSSWSSNSVFEMQTRYGFFIGASGSTKKQTRCTDEDRWYATPNDPLSKNSHKSAHPFKSFWSSTCQVTLYNSNYMQLLWWQLKILAVLSQNTCRIVFFLWFHLKSPENHASADSAGETSTMEVGRMGGECGGCGSFFLQKQEGTFTYLQRCK